MKDSSAYLNIIQEKARKLILYTHHATVQMNSEERLIITKEIREVIEKGNIIEKRLDDPRGQVFLLNHKTTKKRYIHVACSPKKNYLVIITAYVPDPREWRKNFTKRVKI